VAEKPWSRSSWRDKHAEQQPIYDDPKAAEQSLAELATRPPLVAAGEVERLRQLLREAASGQRFVLQGGDCAETFDSCTELSLRSKLEVILQMSLVLTYATRKPVVRIGRIAGQYAKPRSSQLENVAGVEMPSYRGDIVNRAEPTTAARPRPNPPADRVRSRRGQPELSACADRRRLRGSALSAALGARTRLREPAPRCV
jgi:3-deoxy-7-phosphoheptulonate synthase